MSDTDGGGEEKMSTEYSYDNLCIYRDGQPWFPVMGEMHYTRYREDLWEESLRKMKAGGVNIVSTYLIWIHHEEEKGVFDFSGCRNLRKFTEICGKVGLKMILRLGPWIHGEVRNGGFPDWLVELERKGLAARSNDEVYLSYVRKLWEQVYEQVKGLLHQDGGPIIGVQLENEYGHVGGLRGPAGDEHMRTLQALAKELGFQVPLYTATGWGGACIGDALPVMGGYCDAPWDQSVEELSANTNYIISHERNDALIASDHHVEDAVTFDESKFPYLTAELGGGLQVTAHRRPVATGKDIGAMSITKMASGAALLGYYMYHGGSNPKGKFSTLQESRATGYINDLPEINYDFNAPIRQYGTISDSYREVRLLALFLEEFGHDLAALPAYIDPDDVKPEDMHTLRKSVRHDGHHGYIFFNNYVRNRKPEAHRNVVFTGPCEDGDVVFPPVDIESGSFGFFPYNMQLGDAVLTSALVTPLCRLGKGENEVYVFYGDGDPGFCWRDGKSAKVLLLTREQALNACKVSLDREYLVLSKDFVWEENGKLVVIGASATEIRVYPELPQSPKGFVKTGNDREFTVYERKQETCPAKADFTTVAQGIAPAGPKAGSQVQGEALMDRERAWTEYQIQITYSERADRLTGRDTLLWLDYAGFGLEIFLNGEKINDHFYTGQKVPVSLGYFGFPETLTVRVKELREDDWVYLEQWPQMYDGTVCSLNEVSITEEYRYTL